MSNERDAALEALFADSAAETPSEDFTDRVMQGVASRRRNVMLGRISIFAAIILLEVLLSAPVQSSVGFIVDVLGTPLIELSQPTAAELLAPINSVAAVIGAVLLFVHFLYRKILH